MRISSHDERRLSAALLRAYGMCEGDAETVAEAVTLSDHDRACIRTDCQGLRCI